MKRLTILCSSVISILYFKTSFRIEGTKQHYCAPINQSAKNNVLAPDAIVLVTGLFTNNFL